MENEIAKIAQDLIQSLKTTGNISGLRSFYIDSKGNLLATLNDENAKSCKDIGMLYFIMLQSNNFEEDPDERQLMAAIGYYVLSLGVKKNSDKLGIPIKPIEFIEFLKLRILLMLHSKASIKYTLAMRPNNEAGNFSSVFDDDIFEIEQEALTKMIISDAAEIVKWSESNMAMVLSFQKEAINLAKQIINDNARKIQNSSLEDLLYSGKEVHKSMFDLLTSKFKGLQSINASKFDD